MTDTIEYLPFPTVDTAQTPSGGLARCLAAVNDDPKFAFSLTLPEAWRAVDEGPDAKTGSRSFIHSENPNVSIAVNGFLLPRDMSAGDFLMVMILRAGEEIMNRHDTYSVLEGTISDILSARPNSDVVYRSRCIAPRLDYATLAADFLLAASTIQFTKERIATCAERVREVRGHHAKFPFRFTVPESWQVRPRESSSEELAGIELRTFHEGQLVGHMVAQMESGDFGATGPESIVDAVVRRHIEQLKSDGFESDTSIILRGPPLDGFDLVGGVTIPVYLNGNVEEHQESSLTCHVASDKILTTKMFSRPIQKSPEWWAINKRAFEMLNGTLVVDNGTEADEGTQED